MSSIDDCRIIELPKVADARGNLTFLEGNRHVPFEIKRVFYVYDIPSGQSRGAHAHRALSQFVISLSGSLDVELDDGRRKRVVHLNRPWLGLLIPPLIWAAEGNFDPGSVYVVLVDALYDENDYLRDYDEFLQVAKARS